MNMIFWVLEVFLFLMGLVCLKAIFYPDAHARWTLERTRSQMKFYGFEGDIRTTERSSKVIRDWHRMVLVGIIVLMFVSVYVIR